MSLPRSLRTGLGEEGSVLRRAARRAVVAGGPPVQSAARALRRSAFLARVQLAAAAADATVDLDVAPDVRIGARVRVVFAPWTSNALTIGAGSLLEDDVRVQLKGGTVRIGERTEVRRGTLMNVAGNLDVADDVVLSWGCVLHCSASIRIDPMVLVGEYSTFADSSHYFTSPGETAWHNVRSGPITVGRGCWFGAKTTVGRGATIGAHCIVAAGSLVSGQVPDGSLARGVPAQLTALDLPWTR